MVSYVVYGGQSATNLMLQSGDTLTVSAGGIATGTVVTSGGSISNVGTISGTTVGNGGSSLSYGSDVSTVVQSGGKQIVGGGTGLNATVLNGGLETVQSLASASNTIVRSGGTLSIGNAFASNPTVSSGGSLIVSGLAGVTSANIQLGASVSLLNEGRLSGTYISSGVSVTLSGGYTDDYTGTLVGDVIAGAVTVSGYVNFPYAYPASHNINASSTSNTVVSGGSLIIGLLGFDSFTDVKSGGTLVDTGGSISATLLEIGGSILLPLPFVSGGTASYSANGNVLVVSEGGSSYAQTLSGSYSDETFTIAAAASGGTIVGVMLTPGGFNDVAHNTTITNALPDAQTVANTAHALISSAGVVGVGPANYSTALDPAGDIAVYSTINAPNTAITATGTGTSVIAAGSGINTVTVANGTDLIATGAGSNTVYLVTGSNTLDSEGSDSIFVGAGADTINVSGQAMLAGGTAKLSVFLSPNAQLSLSTGMGSVTVQGGFGSGAFSGGTNGNNLLVAGTGPTTLYAGGSGDTLLASGGSMTTLWGYGGNETMVGQYSQGVDVFNFDGANVFATGGAGQNTFNIGNGNSNIVATLGTSVFNVTKGLVGATTYISNFTTSADHLHLTGYAADEVANALGTATTYQGSEILHLRDGTTIGFGGVTGLTQSAFV